ncbi:hypothetical protein GCM10010339_81230 [Streptomyces alanosinicus]|uniref:Uncharacterized protein n=1 Tax=Streptomyces alanosinicus TaxID=68171 RepID=A0A918YSL8_9ACTN|nr:hypothetical protein GCM10010339_81230 [Streptomyces alanosinicus]
MPTSRTPSRSGVPINASNNPSDSTTPAPIISADVRSKCTTLISPGLASPVIVPALCPDTRTGREDPTPSGTRRQPAAYQNMPGPKRFWWLGWGPTNVKKGNDPARTGVFCQSSG